MREIKTTAIIGMGALGMLYGDRILQNLGPEAVCFVADQDRIQKYRTMEFAVNGVRQHFPIVDSQGAGTADLVIVAVKYNALPSALDTMKCCVGPDTTIISVMNGITSEEIIGERYGMDKLVYAIAQGMDAVKFGGELHYTRPGELRIGIPGWKKGPGTQIKPHTETKQEAETETAGDRPRDLAAKSNAETEQKAETAGDRPGNPVPSDRLESLTRFLTRAGISYTVEEEILYRLWGKFMLNVGINQTCMAFETDYGGALEPGKAYDTLVGAMRETMAVAHAEGIMLKEEDITSYIGLIRTLSPTGMPSMRQDGIARRPSEVEMFSGALRKMAAKHGIPVPVNDWLYERIRELEAEY